MNGMNGDSSRSAPSKMLTRLAYAARACSRLSLSQPRLDQLQIPVAVLAPEEVIDHVRRFVEAIRLERLVDLLRHAIEARENPAVFEGLGLETGDSLRPTLGSVAGGSAADA